VVTLKTPWRDGTSHLCFEPLTLIERLAALTPRPRINVVLYHGILAPRAKWRAAAVAYGRADEAGTPDDDTPIVGPAAEAATTSAGKPAKVEQRDVAGPAAAGSGQIGPVWGLGPVAPEPGEPPTSPAPRRRWRWAQLLQRVFAVDVLSCPNCGGRMRVISMIDDPRVVRRILRHLGLAGDEGLPEGPWP